MFLNNIQIFTSFSFIYDLGAVEFHLEIVFSDNKK